MYITLSYKQRPYIMSSTDSGSPSSDLNTMQLPNMILEEISQIPTHTSNGIDELTKIPDKVEQTALELENAFYDNVLFALSIILIIPLIISYKYQPKLISMILTSAVFYINIYHYSHEEKFFVMDFMWSSLLTFTTLVILFLGYKKYGLTPKITAAGLIGGLALYVYLFHGYFPDDVKNPRSVNGYLKFHALWHILGFISLCLIMTIQVDLSLIIQ